MEWTYQIIANHDFTLRDFLHQELLLPKHLIYNLRKNQRVTVNNEYRPMNFQIHQNEQISLKFLPSDFKNPFPHVLPNYHHSIEIIYQTDDLIIVNKPARLKTHPNQPDEVESMLNVVAGYLKPKNEDVYIINRLDMLTSGLLLFAKNPAVVPPLTELIKTKRIQRTYLAWVSGKLPNNKGTINLPIGRDETDKRKRIVNGKNALNAVTHYQVIKSEPQKTLVKVQLETGRTHQIRVHFAAISHPIIGDPLYNHMPSKHRLQLHSWQIRLIRPFSYDHLVITAPLPADFM